METGKTGKYFKYAIGEIILVVIGILIALQINNWNENRKLNEQRKELISNLIIDFKKTGDAIESAINEQEDKLKKMKIFYGLIENNEKVVSVDSLRKLAALFFAEDNFKPNISSYNEAVSNGQLKLVKSRKLVQYIDKFFEASDGYNSIYTLGGEAFFSGPVWELRKSLGSLQLIIAGRNTDSNISIEPLKYNEYIIEVNKPLAIAAFESGYIIKRNLSNNLNEMKTNCDSIILTLNNLD